MDFLSGIVMMIGGWFGFGVAEVVEVIPEPVAVVEQVVETVEQEVVQAVDQIATELQEVQNTSEPQDDMLGAVVNLEEVIQNDIMTTLNEPVTTNQNLQTALVAGGCFWCVEADLEKTPGVIAAVSGYAGGTSENPTYQNYGEGGHREVVEVTYDANIISYEGILIITMKTTDPTDDDGTFADRGDKYSAAFYYENAEQKAIIDNLIAEVNANGPYGAPLAIDVEERPQFWQAEDFHQDYYKGSLVQQAKYKGYRAASGRSRFIQQYWGSDVGPTLAWRTAEVSADSAPASDVATYPWSSYVKPDIETLRATMEATAFRITQEDGTERAGTSPLDKIYEPGIYVDVLSGEPLFSSRDKFDSGTGWPSFVAPITPDAVTAHEDRKLFTVRTETRSAIADNHLGHVFSDGPADRGGLRYCMNGAALRFVPEADMAAQGYSDFLAML